MDVVPRHKSLVKDLLFITITIVGRHETSPLITVAAVDSGLLIGGSATES